MIGLISSFYDFNQKNKNICLENDRFFVKHFLEKVTLFFLVKTLKISWKTFYDV